MRAVALFKNDFVAELQGRRNGVLLEAPQVDNGICGLELRAMVAAARASGDRLRGKKSVFFRDNNAAAGALAKASGEVPSFLAMIEWLSRLYRAGSRKCHQRPTLQALVIGGN